MSAARYWRITGVETDSGNLSVFGIAVHSTAARIDGSATITSGIPPTTGSVSSLVAGGSEVRWVGSNAPGFSITWDFGATADPHKFVISGGSSATEFMRTMSVYYSTDGVRWINSNNKVDIAYLGQGLTVEVGAYRTDDAANFVELILGADSFADSGPRNRSVTTGATSSVQPFPSVNGANSFFFDNTATAEISVATDSNMNLTGQFTVEAWVYPTNYNNNLGTIIGSGSTGPWGSGQFAFRFHNPNGTAPGRLTLVTYENAYVLVSNTTPSLNAWHHVAFTRDSTGMFRIFIDGVLDASTAGFNNALNFSSWATARVGGLFFGESSHRFNGYIDDLRVTKFCRYTGNFTLADYDFARPVVNTSSSAWKLKTPSSNPNAILCGTLPDIASNIGESLPPVDIYDGGKGRIVGTVKEKNSPANIPLRRRVILLNTVDNRHIRTTWSDATTGAYVFNEIDLNRKYTVIAYDHTEAYRAVIADNLSPEPM